MQTVTTSLRITIITKETTHTTRVTSRLTLPRNLTHASHRERTINVSHNVTTKITSSREVAVTHANANLIVAHLNRNTTHQYVSKYANENASVRTLVTTTVPTQTITMAQREPSGLAATTSMYHHAMLHSLLNTGSRLFIRQLPSNLDKGSNLLRRHTVNVMSILRNSTTRTVLTLLRNLNNALNMLIKLNNLNTRKSLLLPHLRLNSTSFRRDLLLNRSRLITLLSVKILNRKDALRVQVRNARLPRNRIILLNGIPRNVTHLSHVSFLLLLRTNRRVLSKVIVLGTIIRVSSVFRHRVFIGTRTSVLIYLVLMKNRRTLRVTTRNIAVKTSYHRLSVRVRNNTLASLIANTLRGNIYHLTLIRNLINRKSNVNQLSNRLNLIQANMISTLRRVLFYRIRRFLVNRVTGNLTIRLRDRHVKLNRHPIPSHSRRNRRARKRSMRYHPKRRTRITLRPTRGVTPNHFCKDAGTPLPTRIININHRDTRTLRRRMGQYRRVLRRLHHAKGNYYGSNVRNVPTPTNRSINRNDGTTPYTRRRMLYHGTRYVGYLTGYRRRNANPRLFNRVVRIPLHFTTRAIPPRRTKSLSLYPRTSRFFSTLRQHYEDLTLQLLYFFFSRGKLLLPSILNQGLRVRVGCALYPNQCGTYRGV